LTSIELRWAMTAFVAHLRALDAPVPTAVAREEP